MVEWDPPVQYAGLLTLLREVFSLDCVDTDRLDGPSLEAQEVTSIFHSSTTC